eukprot:m.34688 g.34688  ORF g.34688 m.34688 type:complete len:427 (+) comp17019_c0_seq1:184-1464(+)
MMMKACACMLVVATLSIPYGANCLDAKMRTVDGEIKLTSDDVHFETSSGTSSVNGIGLSVDNLWTQAGIIETNLADFQTDVNKTSVDAKAERERMGEIIISNTNKVDGEITTREKQWDTMSTLVGKLSEDLVKANKDITLLEEEVEKLKPPTYTTTPKSCKEVIERDPSAKSGQYSVKPPGVSQAFKVYCDHESFGGGWTLIQKIFAGYYRDIMSPAKYAEMMFNAKTDQFTNFLLDDSWYMQGGRTDKKKRCGAWNKAKVNGFARATLDEGFDPVIRLDHKWNPDRWNMGTYLFQRKNASNSFDFWSAIRDSSIWTDNKREGWRIPQGISTPTNGYGTTFIAAKDPGSFSASRNTFEHNTCGDTDYGVWGTQSIQVEGVTVKVSKHAGLMCDGVCHRGNQWMYTGMNNDGRYMNDDDRRSLIYIR